jgi:hypothetical protein
MPKPQPTKINPKQKLFADLYFKYKLDGTKAYMETYGAKLKSARLGAWRLLNENYHVMEYVKYKASVEAAKYDIDKTTIIKELLDMSNYFKELRELGDKESLTDSEKDRFKRLSQLLKGSDYSKIQDMLSKLIGAYEPDKINVKQSWNVSFDDTDTTDDTNNDN